MGEAQRVRVCGVLPLARGVALCLGVLCCGCCGRRRRWEERDVPGGVGQRGIAGGMSAGGGGGGGGLGRGARGSGLVSRDAELEIGVVFVGAFSFLSFPSGYGGFCGGAAPGIMGTGAWRPFYGEGAGLLPAQDLDSALRVDFLHALFFGGFFGGGGGFIALDFGDIVLVVDIPGFLSQ